MYTSFFKLHIKPFQISPDPDFMWVGEKHKEALATLKYGVLDNKGFLLLTGDVGTGKTTLINALTQNLSSNIICASVPDPGLSKLDFFNYMALAFGINKKFSSKGVFLAEFSKFLFNAHEQNKKILLIIDEAQLLTQELLEEIRLLSNIEKAKTKLINIFFVGQNEFNKILNQDINRAVMQRLTLNYNIDPLTPDETQKYIDYRLKVAGAKHSIFDSAAVEEIFVCSGGIPRRINIICDHALLSGYVNDCKIITADIIHECAKELRVPAQVQNRDLNNEFDNFYSQPVTVTAARLSAAASTKPKIRKIHKRPVFFLMIVSAVCVFTVIAWLVIFPVSFKHTLANTKNTIELIKQKSSILIADLVSKDRSDLSQSPLVVTGIVERQEDIDDINKIKDKARNYELLQKHTPEQALTKDKKKILIYKNHESKNTILPLIIPLLETTTTIRFKYNSNDFSEKGLNQLKNFAKIIIMYPDTKILIAGYTDLNGDLQYNKKLSEFRATMVKSFLLGKGVKPEQVKIEGRGSVNPVESNKTAWGRMMNRRVEIEVIRLN